MAKTTVIDVGTVAQESELLAKANEIVKTNVTYSVVAGLLPIPLVDLAGIAAVQIKMLRDLSEHYKIPFSEHRVKNLLGSLVGTAGVASLTGVVGSLFKAIPIVGAIGGAVTMPVLAGASTYAVGKVFIQHFESGGTFLDFDPTKTRAYYEEQLKEGKAVAAAVKETAK